jgi:TrbB protein
MPLNTDTIRPLGQALLVAFNSTGTTGSLSMIWLNRGLTLRRDGLQLMYQPHDSATALVIEQFSSEPLAIQAELALRRAIDVALRQKRFTRWGKAVVLWGVLPLLGAILALTLNVLATKSAVASVPSALTDGVALATPAESLPTAAPARPRPHAADIAKALADGVNTGKFSVPLSTGKPETLYVFSDPSCPHCRDFEAQLDRLRESYSVHLLPVTVIGKDNSAQRVAQLLCEPAHQRAQDWKRLINGERLSLPACAEGVAAAQKNDLMFRALGLLGTPSIVTGDGRVVPDTVELSAQGVSAWMKATAVTQTKP